MRVGGSTLIWAVSVCALGESAAADTVSWQTIPNMAGANDISPDGRWIVGVQNAGGPAYRLDTTTNTLLILPGPGYDAVAVSDDGSVVLGNMDDPGTGGQVAAIWRQSTN